MKENVIMYDNPDIVEKSTIEVWKTKSGIVYLNEDAARYTACTHKMCACGNPMQKYYLKCESCREESSIERYNERKLVEWDQESPVYSDACDEWFIDYDYIVDYCEEHEMSFESLRLCDSKPILATRCHIGEDHFYDELAEDDELPDELLEAIDNFNKAISEYTKPLSWEVGNNAIDVSDWKM